MSRLVIRSVALGAAIVAVAGVFARRSSSSAAVVSAPPVAAIDARPGSLTGPQTAVFAGGCFWGIEAVFEHIKGVIDAVSGYAGGSKDTAEYETVSSGTTGHAESVRVTYDPAQVTYGKLLEVFFSVAHDPTQLNHQGPDYGTQYRSAIFYADSEQERMARAYVDQLTKAHVFADPIVTQVVPLKGFFPAEAYHQNYMVHHPNELYIVINDRPKVEHLKERFPDLYRAPAGER